MISKRDPSSLQTSLSGPKIAATPVRPAPIHNVARLASIVDAGYMCSPPSALSSGLRRAIGSLPITGPYWSGSESYRRSIAIMRDSKEWERKKNPRIHCATREGKMRREETMCIVICMRIAADDITR